MSEEKVLIVGAGEAGKMVFDEIDGHPELEMKPIGYLDDEPALLGKIVGAIPVLGKTDQIEEVIHQHHIDEVIIAIPTASGYFVRKMMKHCRNAGVPFKIVPGVMEVIRGEVHIDQLREMKPEDLLGRETVDFNLDSVREELRNKRILVTGAGGSIGSEICRQVAMLEPRELILLGRGENRIFDIEEELKSQRLDFDITTAINNLREEERVLKLVEQISPDIVYHTAAHKHVHYMEREPSEAVLNNIKGSINLINAAEKCGVEKFVFISSDKAANPSSVMGATKRIVELYLSSRVKRSPCHYVVVRFGNVIGSSGSVVPLFQKQIERGGPVTVSSPEATRYFMSVKEASLLVIRASVLGGGGETFILDMGEPINILELARDIIIMTGHEPDKEIGIEITGLRDGEKLHEQLANDDEELAPVEQHLMLAKSSREVPEKIDGIVDKLIKVAEEDNDKKVLDLMTELIPQFKQRDIDFSE
jgi:FlaA1/EpsC-like NDP-sugar epimerase